MGQGSVVLEVSEDMKSGVDGPGDMRQQLREGIRAYSKPITVCHHMFFIQKRRFNTMVQRALGSYIQD